MLNAEFPNSAMLKPELSLVTSNDELLRATSRNMCIFEIAFTHSSLGTLRYMYRATQLNNHKIHTYTAPQQKIHTRSLSRQGTV